MSAFANVLNLALHYQKYTLSFINFHNEPKRETPDMFYFYTLTLIIFKTCYNMFSIDKFTHMNFDQCINLHKTFFKTLKSNNRNVGMNALSSIFLLTQRYDSC
jgi:superoxide dismutase